MNNVAGNNTHTETGRKICMKIDGWLCEWMDQWGESDKRE
jgi:hypothetical protein